MEYENKTDNPVESSSMNDFKENDFKENDFKDWKNRISQLKNYYEEADKKLGWTRFRNYFLGNYLEALDLGNNTPVVPINLVYSFIKTSIANLYIKDPYITVNPKRKGEVLGSKIKEQSINYEWRQNDLKRQIKRNIGDAKLIGFSWIKLGYDAELSTESVGPQETNEYIAQESLWATWIPQNKDNGVWYDPDSIDPPFDCRYLVHYYKKPTEFLKNKYDKEIKGGYIKKNDLVKVDETHDEYNYVYEIWDKESGNKLVMCDGCEEWLEEVAPVAKGCIGSYLMEGFPFELLYFNPIVCVDGKYNFPISDVSAGETQILEKIKIRSMQLNHLKRFGRQMIAKKDALSDAEMEKYMQGIDGAIILAETTTGSLSDVVMPINYAAIQSDMYAVENRIDAEMDRILGQSAMEQGGTTQSKSRTLGELKFMQQGSDSRSDEQADMIEMFCARVAKKMLQIMKQYFDIPRYARITGEAPAGFLKELQAQGKFDGVSIQYTKEDIQGEEDVEVIAGSTIPMNKDNRMRAVLEAARVGQAFGLTPASAATMAMGKEYFSSIGLKSIEEGYEYDLFKLTQPKQPDPMEQLKVANAQADLKKKGTDNSLKEERINSVNLGNVSKALDNSDKLSGKDKKNEVPVRK